MKMSAWIRFCLIVLCLAMACSMFACNTPEEQTTEAPVVDTTEAPSDEPTTEKPTEKPTETPTEVTTEEPVITTEPTEVTTEPTEVTTEPTEVTTEPTEVTTEPTEVTTEVPATETTEAPATETTEAPETETTETETTPSEVETATDITIGGDVIEEGDSGYIEEAVSPYKYNCDSHGGAVGSTFTTKIDPLTGIITGIKGWFAVEPGVMAYKYALVIDGVQQDMVDVTKANLPDGSGTVGYDRSDVVNHVAKNYPGFNASVAGHNIGFNFTHVLDYATLAELHGHSVEIKYYAVIFKVDVEGNRYVNENEEYEEGAYVLLATFKDIMPEHFGVRGYRDNGDGTHSILCQACDVYYATEQCPAAKGEGATWVDTNSHSGMTCTLCGQTGVKGAHSAPTNTIWNSETNSYETILNPIVWNDEAKLYWSQCVACGGQVGEMFPAIIDMQAEDMKLGQPSWATKQINITDLDGTACASITKMLFSGADGWSNSYFYINPLQIGTGRYMAIRYRIMLADGDRSLVIRTDTNNGYTGSVNAPLVNDGKWHIVVVDLASVGAFAPDANGNYIMSNSSRLEFTSWTVGDIILLDWFKTYDSLDAIILEQSACECPNFALEGVATGAEGHTPTCKFCGKEFALTAHTPSPWGRYDAEAGKYVSDCTVCGYACDVFGNVVFSGDALAGVSSSLTKEATDDGVKFTNPDNKDRNFTLFQGMSGKETGKYLFVKYRASGATNSQIFSATDAAAPTGSRNGKPTIDNDGEWHIAVVDMTKVVPTYPAGADGKYYIQHFRWDIEGSEGCWIEIAYIGFASDPVALAKSIKALDPAAVEICECPSAIQVVEYVDTSVHALTCQICGSSTNVDHTPAYGVWSDTLGYYVGQCGVCDGATDVDYGCTVSAGTEAFFRGTVWSGGSYSHVQGDEYDTLNFKSTSYTATHFRPNPNGYVTGQYLVIRYRVPLAEGQTAGNMGNGSMYLTVQSEAGTAKPTYYWSFICDNEWHAMIVDMAALGITPNADGTYTFAKSADTRAIHQGWDHTKFNPSIQIAGIEFYDSLDRISNISKDLCHHPDMAKKTTSISDTQHAVVCVICGQEFDKADHVYTTTNCVDGWVCSCGQPSAPTEHTTAGTNNEYCTTCKSFVNADPATLFNKFVGAENLPYVSSLGNVISENGYRVYTRTTEGESYVQPSFDGSETGQFMVMKFKATGSMNFDFFTSTVQAGADGKYTFRYVPATYDEWQYLIVDLSKKIGNSGVVADGNGKYCIKGLRLDVQSHKDVGDLSGTGTAEIAYIAYANSIEKLVAGIKALEGVENVKNDYCLCDVILNSYVSEDDATHNRVCALCGASANENHTFYPYATWNETSSAYEANCSICGGGKEVREWQWSRDYSAYANGKTFGSTGGGKTHSVQDGVLAMSPNGNTSWGGVSVACDSATQLGQYYVLKYRVTEVKEAAETASIILRFGNQTKTIALVADGEWHTMVVDISYAGTASNGMVTLKTAGDHWFLNYADANLVKYEVAFEGCVISEDHIPTEYVPAE